MICPKCKTINKKEAKFCIDCGFKLERPIEEKKSKLEDKSKKIKIPNWVLISLGIIIILTIIVIFTVKIGTFRIDSIKSTFNSEPNCINVQTPYETQEEYMKTEYYTESVPYTDRECEAKNLVYKVEKGSCQNRQSGLFGLGDKPAKFSCTITNLDSEGGRFSMRIGFKTGNNQNLETTQSQYIYPQSSENFVYTFDAQITGCYCYENIPTKQVCRDVIQYKEVQKERQVTAYRPVTKYKTEQKCN